MNDVSLDHDDDVRQRRQIRAAGDARSHDGRDLRNFQIPPHDRVVIEDSRGAVLARKHAALIRQIHARRIDQIDDRHSERIAISCARRIFLIVSGHHDPALTVASLATTTTSRPSTRPTTVTTPAPGAAPVSCQAVTLSPLPFSLFPCIDRMRRATRFPAHTNPYRASRSIRSRAVSFPWLCCRSILSGPPPRRSRASSSCNSAVNLLNVIGTSLGAGSYSALAGLFKLHLMNSDFRKLTCWMMLLSVPLFDPPGHDHRRDGCCRGLLSDSRLQHLCRRKDSRHRGQVIYHPTVQSAGRFQGHRHNRCRPTTNKELTLDDYEYLKERATLVGKMGPRPRHTLELKRGDQMLEDVFVSGATPAIADIENRDIADGRFMCRPEDEAAAACGLPWRRRGHQAFSRRKPGRSGNLSIAGLPYRVIGVETAQRNGLWHSAGQLHSGTCLKLMRINFGGLIRQRSLYFVATSKTDALFNDAVEEARFLMRVRRKLGANEKDNFGIVTPDAITGLRDRLFGTIFIVAMCSSEHRSTGWRDRNHEHHVGIGD